MCSVDACKFVAVCFGWGLSLCLPPILGVCSVCLSYPSLGAAGVSCFVPASLLVCRLFPIPGSLPPPVFLVFVLFSIWVFLFPFFLIFWLFLPSLLMCGCRHTHRSVLVFSQVPGPVACCCEVSVGCLASVQGFVSAPFPSLHLLAQTSAATLGLAGGGCPAVKWVVCEGVGIPLVPCSLASGSALARSAAVGAAEWEPAGGSCAWYANSRGRFSLGRDCRSGAHCLLFLRV